LFVEFFSLKDDQGLEAETPQVFAVNEQPNGIRVAYRSTATQTPGLPGMTFDGASQSSFCLSRWRRQKSCGSAQPCIFQESYRSSTLEARSAFN